MDRNVPEEPRSWWMPDTDPDTAARELHDGLERLREHVAAYRERRMKLSRPEDHPAEADGARH